MPPYQPLPHSEHRLPRTNCCTSRPLRASAGKRTTKSWKSTQVAILADSNPTAGHIIYSQGYCTSPCSQIHAASLSSIDSVKNKSFSIRKVQTEMHKSRSPSPASTNTAYEDNWEDATCPSPVIGEGQVSSGHNFLESSGWRRSYPPNTEEEDINELPSDRAADPEPIMQEGNEEGDASLVPVKQPDDLSMKSRDAGFWSHLLCTRRSLPILSTLRTQPSLKHRIVSKAWLQKSPPSQNLVTEKLGVKNNMNCLKEPVQIPERGQSKMATVKYHRGALSLKKRPSKPRVPEGEKSSKGLNSSMIPSQLDPLLHDPVTMKEWRDSWHDYVTEMRGLERSSATDGKLLPKKTSPVLAPVLQEATLENKLKEVNHTENLTKKSITFNTGLSKKPINTDASGSPMSSIKNITSRSMPVLPLLRKYNAQHENTHGEAIFPPRPRPRTSSRFQTGTSLHVDALASVPPSIPEESPGSILGASNGQQHNPPVAGEGSTSHFSPVISSTGVSVRGPHPAASTDTLSRIEARVQKSSNSPAQEDSRKIVQHYRGDSTVSLISMRSNGLPSTPPERPLPELPVDRGQTYSQRASTASRASSRSRHRSHRASLCQGTLPQANSVSSASSFQHGFVKGDTLPNMSSPRKKGATRVTMSPRRARETGAAKNLSLNIVKTIPDVGTRTDLVSPSSVYSQGSLVSGHSYPLPNNFSDRADRVHALKKRDMASAYQSHERRIPEEREEDSNDPMGPFPLTPNSRPGSRASIPSQTGPQSPPRKQRCLSSTRQGQLNRDSCQALAQSKIMVVTDAAPITEMIRTGFASPRSPIASVTAGSPWKGGITPMVKTRASQSSLRNQTSVAALTTALLHHQRRQASQNSSSSSPGRCTVLSDQNPATTTPTAVSNKYQPHGEDRQRNLNQDAEDDVTIKANRRLEVLNITQQISAVHDYMMQLEAEHEKQKVDIDKQKLEIEELKKILTWALRRDYWEATRDTEGFEQRGCRGVRMRMERRPPVSAGRRSRGMSTDNEETDSDSAPLFSSTTATAAEIAISNVSQVPPSSSSSAATATTAMARSDSLGSTWSDEGLILPRASPYEKRNQNREKKEDTSRLQQHHHHHYSGIGDAPGIRSSASTTSSTTNTTTITKRRGGGDHTNNKSSSLSPPPFFLLSSSSTCPSSFPTPHDTGTPAIPSDVPRSARSTTVMSTPAAGRNHVHVRFHTAVDLPPTITTPQPSSFHTPAELHQHHH